MQSKENEPKKEDAEVENEEKVPYHKPQLERFERLYEPGMGT